MINDFKNYWFRHFQDFGIKPKSFYFCFSGYFDEKAMPSAGFVPFLQSFFCTFNNTCYDHEQKNFGSIQNYNDSL
jgi:hypothetical protein